MHCGSSTSPHPWTPDSLWTATPPGRPAQAELILRSCLVIKHTSTSPVAQRWRWCFRWASVLFRVWFRFKHLRLNPVNARLVATVSHAIWSCSHILLSLVRPISACLITELWKWVSNKLNRNYYNELKDNTWANQVTNQPGTMIQFQFIYKEVEGMYPKPFF